jgi:hypothetical protein
MVAIFVICIILVIAVIVKIIGMDNTSKEDGAKHESPQSKRENTLLEDELSSLEKTFQEQVKNGAKIYTLLKVYHWRFDITPIITMLHTNGIPYYTEFFRDSESYTRYPEYWQNYILVYILDDDYNTAIKVIENCDEICTDDNSFWVEIFYKDD